jgi:twinkle protein
MGKTLLRQVCHKCNKRNLCTYLDKFNNKQTRCMTEGCSSTNNIGNITKEVSNSQFIDSIDLEFKDFTEPYRDISPETCKKLGIQHAVIGDKTIIRYEHKNSDGTVSYKLRYPNKVFEWKPKAENTNMFALDKCVDFTKPLIITEGNEDCATLWDLGFQACSLLCAGSEYNDLELDIDKINKFESIYLCIEQDKAGKKATKNIKEILKHKLLFEVDLNPRKDANDWIKEDPDRNELVNRINNATEVVPNGIVFGMNLNKEVLWEDPPLAIPFPWPGLNETMTGLEYGQLYGIFGGSSIGKSSVLRELVYYFRTSRPELKIANIFLEENQRITPLVYLALAKNIPLGKLKRDKSLIDPIEREELYNTILNTENLMFIDEKYDRDSETLLKTIEYLASVKKYDIILLDHISYIIGRSKIGKNGERRDIDELLYALQDKARNLNIIIIFACHLSDPSQPPGWDEGRVPGLYNGRGSRVLAQVPDGIIGISRNMIDKGSCDILGLHNLKNRWDGTLGKIQELVYISATGRLVIK